MKPGWMWIGLVLLGLGMFGILDVAGVIDAGRTIGEWWPLAIIAWPLLEMLAARSLSLGWLIVLAVGVAFLADEQDWGSDALVWSVFAVAVGLAVLVDASLSRSRSIPPSGSKTGQSANWWDACWEACWPSSAGARSQTQSDQASSPAPHGPDSVQHGGVS